MHNYGPITGVGEPSETSLVKYFLKEKILDECSKARYVNKNLVLESVNLSGKFLIQLQTECNEVLKDDVEIGRYREVIESSKNLLFVRSEQLNSQ